jgi:hypothetical protein
MEFLTQGWMRTGLLVMDRILGDPETYGEIATSLF